ncbi:MAG: copper transporter [Actinomycetaceae bacterium]|nr:copper transporter [Actinomycetaceae bacterium]
MIDFRYHLVSLMSVLIALTLGVILGAGPLQGPLSAALTGQVNRLTTEHAQLTKDLRTANKQLEGSAQVVASLAGALLPGTLTDAKVGLITVAGAEDADIQSVSDKLTAAGAKIVGRFDLKNDWFTEGKSTYRSQLTSAMSQYLETPPAQSATADEILGTGLVQMLEKPGDKSSALAQIYASKDSPLLTVATPVSEAATAIVVIGPHQEDSGAPVDTKQNDKGAVWADEALVGFTKSLDITHARTVIAGSAATDNSFLAKVRATSAKVTTVDSLGTKTGQFAVPFALKRALDGKVGAYGSQIGASKLFPVIEAKK